MFHFNTATGGLESLLKICLKALLLINIADQTPMRLALFWVLIGHGTAGLHPVRNKYPLRANKVDKVNTQMRPECAPLIIVRSTDIKKLSGKKNRRLTSPGFEPGIFRSVVRRSNRCATKPRLIMKEIIVLGRLERYRPTDRPTDHQTQWF